MQGNKIKTIKKVEKEKVADYQRQHEIALLKILAPKYPDLIKQLAQTFTLNKNSCNNS